ncbi:hypothetical protein Csa_016231 [Cucumis sativus]|uniref:Uncharacterized protein n=1 Tax=Cucumis sativus TaxID=3659 RepID=A0A0A0KCS0_CUCSA|nr:hypothetical protein Csa_016231 [Cucumis sativus]
MLVVGSLYVEFSASTRARPTRKDLVVAFIIMPWEFLSDLLQIRIQVSYLGLLGLPRLGHLLEYKQLDRENFSPIIGIMLSLATLLFRLYKPFILCPTFPLAVLELI